MLEGWDAETLGSYYKRQNTTTLGTLSHFKHFRHFSFSS